MRNNLNDPCDKPIAHRVDSLDSLREALRLVENVISADGDKGGALKSAAGFLKKGVRSRHSAYSVRPVD